MAVFTFSPAGAQWVSIDFIESGREFVSTIFESYRETFNSNQIKLYFGDATMTFAGRGLAVTTYLGELADVTAGTMTGLFVDLNGGHRVISVDRVPERLARAGAFGAEPLDLDEVALKIYLYSRAQSVMGGTSQIQKNIIATRILGLPTG